MVGGRRTLVDLPRKRVAEAPVRSWCRPNLPMRPMVQSPVSVPPSGGRGPQKLTGIPSKDFHALALVGSLLSSRTTGESSPSTSEGFSSEGQPSAGARSSGSELRIPRGNLGGRENVGGQPNVTSLGEVVPTEVFAPMIPQRVHVSPCTVMYVSISMDHDLCYRIGSSIELPIRIRGEAKDPTTSTSTNTSNFNPNLTTNGTVTIPTTTPSSSRDAAAA